MSSLRDYLVQMDRMAKEMRRPDSFEGYVLRNGRPVESQELTPDELSYILAITRRGVYPIKQCYYNSQMILTTRDRERRLTYVEGYCAGAIIPVLHGWLEIGGKVVDVTMRTRVASSRARLPDRVLGDWSDGREYFGVPMNCDYVLERMIARQAAGSLIDDWEAGFPLLRKDHEQRESEKENSRDCEIGGANSRSEQKNHGIGEGAH